MSKPCRWRQGAGYGACDDAGGVAAVGRDGGVGGMMLQIFGAHYVPFSSNPSVS